MKTSEYCVIAAAVFLAIAAVCVPVSYSEPMVTELECRQEVDHAICDTRCQLTKGPDFFGRVRSRGGCECEEKQ